MVRGWLSRRDRDSKSSKTAINTNNSSTNFNKFNVRFFSYDSLQIATNNFSTFIDRGAYGSVFKGLLSNDGRTVAIKIIHNTDQHRSLAVVEFMSHLQHVNLIQSIGCCVENSDNQILVYKFADNGNLSQQLHVKKSSALTWERRAAVCIGVARGLSYLHEEIDPRVIHCDIKPANILLDSNFVPKIVDFDLADLVDGFGYVKGGKRTANGITESQDQDVEDSFNYTTVKGTPGYMDPNYISTGKLTEKVDVYSFGVTMLEIITGRRVVDTTVKEIDDRMILNWVTRMSKEGRVFEIVDSTLTDVPKEDVERFINVALLCTQAAPEQRPSMFRVVHMLYGGHKSDQEISEMAAAVVVAAQPVAQWLSRNSSPTSVSTSSSLTMSTSGIADNTDGSTSRDKISSKGARSDASSSKEEEQSCKEDLVRAYFERSMEKIMRFQAATKAAQTMVIGKSSQRINMEAVYPPFLSGEYARRPSQLLDPFTLSHYLL